MRHLAMLTLAVLIEFLAPSVHAQNMPLYWVGPVRVEEGIPISKSTPIGSVTVGCPVDNFTNAVDWGDGNKGSLISPNAAYTITLGGKPVTLVGSGTYPLYAVSDKVYGPAVQGIPPMAASISSTLHCYGAGETAHWSVAANIYVYPHTPLRQLTVAPGTRGNARNFAAQRNHPLTNAGMVAIKGGTSFILTAISTDSAPPSNAHVSLTWTGSGASLILSPASLVQIPDGLFTVSTTFKTKATKSNQRVTVTANSGVGTPVPVTFEITR